MVPRFMAATGRKSPNSVWERLNYRVGDFCLFRQLCILFSQDYRYNLGSIAGTRLFPQALPIRAQRPNSNSQFVRDLLVDHPPRSEVKNFLLSIG
jgi:hypothetical protein